MIEASGLKLLILNLIFKSILASRLQSHEGNPYIGITNMYSV
jgi:hypothetical protein